MMAKNSENESCEVAKSLSALEGRVTNVEGRLDKMEGSLTIGFSQVNTAVQDLAKQFGERMNIIERKVVDEKAEWGKVLRKVALWSAATILSGAAVAMGVTIWKNFHAAL